MMKPVMRRDGSLVSHITVSAGGGADVPIEWIEAYSGGNNDIFKIFDPECHYPDIPGFVKIPESERRGSFGMGKVRGYEGLFPYRASSYALQSMALYGDELYDFSGTRIVTGLEKDTENRLPFVLTSLHSDSDPDSTETEAEFLHAVNRRSPGLQILGVPEDELPYHALNLRTRVFFDLPYTLRDRPAVVPIGQTTVSGVWTYIDGLAFATIDEAEAAGVILKALSPRDDIASARFSVYNSFE